MNKITSYIKENKIELISISLIAIFALILRIISLLNCGEIWYDELFSWYFASRDSVFSTISSAGQEDIHMPLYFILLHFWLKIVGTYNINGMRFFSLLLFMPLIPFSYYMIKNLFNKTAAYFSVIYITINTFCIYYSNEIRFYSLTLLFSFLLACFFVKMLLNFDKKNSILYIFCASVLFYTFSIVPLLAFIYFISGMIYLYLKNKSMIKNFFIIHLILFIICLPAIFLTFSNAIEMHKVLTYYPLDNFMFDSRMIFDILENFFSTVNRQIWVNNFLIYINMFEEIQNPIYFIFVFIPILLALFGLVKALISKNEKIYLFLLPSLIFLIVLFILGMTHSAVLQTRYLTIIFPVIICSVCFGFSNFKNYIAPIALFVTFVFLNLLRLPFDEYSIFSLDRVELSELNYIFKSVLKLNKNDYILAPMPGNKISFYARNGKIVPFSVEGAFVLKDRKSTEFYLGEDYKKYTRDNIKAHLFDYIMNDKIYEIYEKNLYENYIKNLAPNERIIFIVFYGNLINHPFERGLTYKNYNNFNIVSMLFSKALRDTYLILNKYLKNTTSYNLGREQTIFVFEKK